MDVQSPNNPDQPYLSQIVNQSYCWKMVQFHCWLLKNLTQPLWLAILPLESIREYDVESFMRIRDILVTGSDQAGNAQSFSYCMTDRPDAEVGVNRS